MGIKYKMSQIYIIVAVVAVAGPSNAQPALGRPPGSLDSYCE